MKTTVVTLATLLALMLGLVGGYLPVAAAPVQQTSGAALSSLSAVELASLPYMREEEKLARDVYAVLYQAYGAQVFLNIGASEQTHFDQMGVLLERYDVADPALAPGLFAYHHIQELYDLLVPMGLASLKDAYTVGAIIEEVDILDFQHYLADAEVDNADIRRVYTDLMNASKNHLRAFVRCLASVGVVYVPQYLSLDQYQTILAEETGGVGGYSKH